MAGRQGGRRRKRRAKRWRSWTPGRAACSFVSFGNLQKLIKRPKGVDNFKTTVEFFLFSEESDRLSFFNFNLKLKRG